MQKTFYKVADFVSWQKDKSLVLSPDFQRRSVWKPGAKSYLMDTIVRDLPIPIIFLRDKRTDPNSFEPTREVIDGQQRLRTILSFICPEFLSDYEELKDKFTVRRTHNKEIAGKLFKDLPDDTKGKILDYEFNVHVLPATMDDREIIQIFRRMNSTSYSLTKQELRNASYFGEFKSLAYKLAAEQLHRWRAWKIFTQDDIARMVEVEFTSECMLSIMEGKISGKSAARLDKAYGKYDEEFREHSELQTRFRETVGLIDENFGKDLTDFVFFKKTLIYTFLMFIYDVAFGFDSLHKKNAKPKKLNARYVGAIKLASERIRKRTAPKDVLEATDRRTTNPMERSRLFNYLKKSTSNA